MNRVLISILILLAAVTSNAATDDSFSHADWNAVLSAVVDTEGMVDYQKLHRDRSIFDRYIKQIETISPDNRPELFPTTTEQLAYFINAYNAQVFKGVLSRGPEKKSVWRGLVSGYNFFSKMKISVGGKQTNLKKLEDDNIRARFKDPRIHAAINCASISCPRLPQTAFIAENLEQQLDDAMKEFVNSEMHVQLDQTKRVANVSKIFTWFEEDFIEYERANGNLQPKLLHYINHYRETKIPADFKIKFLPYDKGINQQ